MSDAVRVMLARRALETGGEAGCGQAQAGNAGSAAPAPAPQTRHCIRPSSINVKMGALLDMVADSSSDSRHGTLFLLWQLVPRSHCSPFPPKL
jgi:hypothetical protein